MGDTECLGEWGQRELVESCSLWDDNINIPMSSTPTIRKGAYIENPNTEVNSSFGGILTMDENNNEVSHDTQNAIYYQGMDRNRKNHELIDTCLRRYVNHPIYGPIKCGWEQNWNGHQNEEFIFEGDPRADQGQPNREIYRPSFGRCSDYSHDENNRKSCSNTSNPECTILDLTNPWTDQSGYQVSGGYWHNDTNSNIEGSGYSNINNWSENPGSQTDTCQTSSGENESEENPICSCKCPVYGQTRSVYSFHGISNSNIVNRRESQPDNYVWNYLDEWTGGRNFYLHRCGETHPFYPSPLEVTTDTNEPINYGGYTIAPRIYLTGLTSKKTIYSDPNYLTNVYQDCEGCMGSCTQDSQGNPTGAFFYSSQLGDINPTDRLNGYRCVSEICGESLDGTYTRVNNHICEPCPANHTASESPATGPDTYCSAPEECSAPELPDGVIINDSPNFENNENFNVQLSCDINLGYEPTNIPPTASRGSCNPDQNIPFEISGGCRPIYCQENERVENHQCVSCNENILSLTGDQLQGGGPGYINPVSSESCIAIDQSNTEHNQICSNVVLNQLNCVNAGGGGICNYIPEILGDSRTGSDTICDIEVCNENFHVQNSQCVPCPSGQRRVAGDLATDGDTQCSVYCIPPSELSEGVQTFNINLKRDSFDVTVQCNTENGYQNDELGGPNITYDSNNYACGTTPGNYSYQIEGGCSPVLCELNQHVENNQCVDCPPNYTRNIQDFANGPNTICSAPTDCSIPDLNLSPGIELNTDTSNDYNINSFNVQLQCSDGYEPVCTNINITSSEECINSGGVFTSVPINSSNDPICYYPDIDNQEQCINDNKTWGPIASECSDALNDFIIQGGCNNILCNDNERVFNNTCICCPPGTTSLRGSDASGTNTTCEPIICSSNQHIETYTEDRSHCEQVLIDNNLINLIPPNEIPIPSTNVDSYRCSDCQDNFYREAGDNVSLQNQTVCQSCDSILENSYRSGGMSECSINQCLPPTDIQQGYNYDSSNNTIQCSDNYTPSSFDNTPSLSCDTNNTPYNITGECIPIQCTKPNQQFYNQLNLLPIGDALNEDHTINLVTGYSSENLVGCPNGYAPNTENPPNIIPCLNHNTPYQIEGSCIPVLCENNQYKTDNICQPCPPGTTSNGEQSITCEPILCNQNEYALNHVCTSCPLGTIHDPGDDSSGEGTPCIPNICEINQYVENNTCLNCAAGTTNVAGNNASGLNTECVPTLCGENQYVENNTCLNCAAGSTNVAGNDASGLNTECSPILCDENQYVENNTCLPCPAGTTNVAGNDASGLNTECVPTLCEINQYVENNTCLDCLAGTTNVVGNDASGLNTECSPILCDENQYVENNECLDCLAGTTNVSGNDASGLNTSCVATLCGENQYVENNTCLDCLDGTTNVSGNDASGLNTSCSPILCNENQYVENNTCVDCLVGSTNISGDDASNQNTDCDITTCDINHFVYNNICLPCPPGTSNPRRDNANGSNTFCEPNLCNENEYVLNHICTSCPPGTIHDAGDDSSGPGSECIPVFCEINQYVSNNSCLSCPPGTTKSVGDNSSGDDTVCETTICELNNYVSDNTCLPCPPGTNTATRHDSSGINTTCDPIFCEENEYALNHVCTQCPLNTFHLSGDDASGPGTPCIPNTCEENQYVLNNECVSCPINTWNESGDIVNEDSECNPVICNRPSDINGYTIINETLEKNNFNIEIECSPHFHGSPTVTPCENHNEEYTIEGCSPNICSSPSPPIGYGNIQENELHSDPTIFSVTGSCDQNFYGTFTSIPCENHNENYQLTNCILNNGYYIDENDNINECTPISNMIQGATLSCTNEYNSKIILPNSDGERCEEYYNYIPSEDINSNDTCEIFNCNLPEEGSSLREELDNKYIVFEGNSSFEPDNFYVNARCNDETSIGDPTFECSENGISFSGCTLTDSNDCDGFWSSSCDQNCNKTFSFRSNQRGDGEKCFENIFNPDTNTSENREIRSRDNNNNCVDNCLCSSSENDICNFSCEQGEGLCEEDSNCEGEWNPVPGQFRRYPQLPELCEVTWNVTSPKTGNGSDCDYQDGETILFQRPRDASETQNQPEWCNVNDLPLMRCTNNIDPEDNWTNQRCSEAHERPFYVLQNSHNIFLRSDQSDIHHELCCTEDIQPINFEDGDIIPVSQTMNDYFNR